MENGIHCFYMPLIDYFSMPKLLLEKGAHKSINAQSSNYGLTPLMLAVDTNNIDLIKLILRYNPDLNIRSIYKNRTALEWAIYAVEEDCIRAYDPLGNK